MNYTIYNQTENKSSNNSFSSTRINVTLVTRTLDADRWTNNVYLILIEVNNTHTI